MITNITTDKRYEQAISYYKNLEFGEAEKLLSQIICEHPADYDVLNFLGIINLNLKNYDSAIIYFKEVVNLNSFHKSAYYNLGYCLQELENYEEALQYYYTAISLDAEYLDAIINCGVIFLNQHNLQEAESYFNYCLSINPHCHEALNNLGNLSMQNEKYDDAAAYYSSAAEADPDNPLYLCNLGKAYEQLNRTEEAISCFEKTLMVEKQNSDACLALGNIYLQQGKNEQAKFYFDQSGDKSTLAAAELTNKGVEKLSAGEIKQAIAYFDQAIYLNPEVPEIHYNKSHALLLTAQYDEGLREYEWRLKRNEFKDIKLKCPLNKDHSIINKRILILDEQGIGDTIQFLRLISLLKARGAYTIFCCKDSVLDLLNAHQGIDEIIPMSQGIDKIKYDYDIFLMSLAHFCHLDEKKIPQNIPYIFPQKNKLEKWQSIIPVSSKFKVGLVWAGNPNHTGDTKRSCSLPDLSPLFEISEAEFYSLQKGEAVNQIEKFKSSLFNLDSYNHSFSDVCAAINYLDLVITVDTSIAHLAGAMGKETWLMIPFLPDWRWMLNRNDTPWYPGMKLFRQTSAGDWRNVIAEVKKNLMIRLTNIKK